MLVQNLAGQASLLQQKHYNFGYCFYVRNCNVKYCCNQLACAAKLRTKITRNILKGYLQPIFWFSYLKVNKSITLGTKFKNL